MANSTERPGSGQGSIWRVIGWSSAAALLLLPFIAMQFTKEVNWTASDFIFMGVLIGTVGGLFELAVKISGDWAYRAGFGLALLGGFLTIWINLAVGIVGSEDRPANLWFFAALLVAMAGAGIARLRAKRMVWAMGATALALGIAFSISASGPTGEPRVPHTRELAGTSILMLLFLGSAGQFRKAARQSSSSS